MLVANAAVAGAAVPGSAVYKCAGPAGTPVYQEDVCAPGKELRNFATDPPSLSVVPGTPLPPPAIVYRSVAPGSDRTAQRSRAPPREAIGDASERRHVHTGMTDAEVLAKLGRPQMSARAAKGKMRWTYLPAVGDPNTITTLTLERGAVVDVERRVVR